MDDDAIAPGKLPVALLARLLDAFPRAPRDVRVGPALGEDACAIDVGDEVLVVAADPVTLTGSDVGRYAVVVNANDVAVTGAVPRWFLATLLFPLGTSAREVDDVFRGLHAALERVGAALVGGHTEVTGAVRSPVVAGVMLGTAPDGRVVTTGGAGAGDVVVQVGAAPVEGGAVLATEARERLGGVDAAVVEAARHGVVDPGISVVDAALLAAELGATSLHDPTEGGLASGLHEVASASGVRLRIVRDRVRWFAPARAVCDALGANPWATLASGCLLATFPPDIAPHALAQLEAHGFDVAALGEADAEAGEGVVADDGGPIPWPARDEVARLLL